MNRPDPRPRGGAAGPWLVICLAALATGAAFDFGADHPAAFWIGMSPGAAAALGAGAACFAVIAGHAARTLLRRREYDGERRARRHS